MSDSEVNRLKTGAFTFGFETLPPSSCLSHLTIIVSHLSLCDKLNLICDVEVCVGLFYSTLTGSCVQCAHNGPSAGCTGAQ